MKNFSKILAFCILSLFFVSNAAADEWAEEDCLKYEQLIGGLAWLSGETLDMSDKRWASNLVSKINRSHASKTNEIELHLSPKNLGKLKIKISVSNKTAFVKVSTDSAATSSMILNEENKLSEMLKEVGLELEDFSSENSFNQSFSNGEQGKTKNKFKSADANNSNDINDHENYIKDESLLNIKV